MLVTANTFRLFGVSPTVGRDFRPEEDQVPDRDRVVILSHAFAIEQFGAEAMALGRVVQLNGTDFTVIGVTARSKGMEAFNW